ncbi:MAG: Ig-like domain-containing protein [bacterium]
MNSTIFAKGLGCLILILISLLILTSPSFAVTYNLAAAEVEWTPPGSIAAIPMWGFVEATVCPSQQEIWNMGPILEVPAGDGTLTINLRNCLTEPVSIIIPGQGIPAVTGGIPAGTLIDGQGRQRLTSFVAQADVGGTVTYTWTNLKPGTYLYLSGSHPAKQVQMGLYGALKVYATDGGAYPGISPDNEVLLLYSEIDPKLHATTSSKVAQPLNYKPEYFLINGAPWPDASPILTGPTINTGQQVLIRFLNAGLNTLVPTLLRDRMSVIAEDGNLYSYPKDQYSVLLTAGKTKDALWNPRAAHMYPVYDARHHLTNAGVSGGGMLVKLLVEGNHGPGITSMPATMATEGVLYSYDAGASDPDVGDILTYSLDISPAGMIIDPLTGLIQWTPPIGEAGDHSVTLRVTDTGGLFATQTFTISVALGPGNHKPLITSTPITTATEGVLYSYDADASDPDAGDIFTYSLDISPAGMTIDPLTGLIQWTPAIGDAGDHSVTLRVMDTGGLFSTQTFTITVSPVPENQLPIVKDDFTETLKNTEVTINLLLNDYDLDGFLLPGSVVITTLPIQGGTVIINADGTVTYTPPSNFKGTDIFYYSVQDNDGASGEAMVSVNVVNKLSSAGSPISFNVNSG